MSEAEQEERDRIERLMQSDRAVFVFGSNLAGRHGAGAAADATALYGALYGKGSGFQGRSYAIATKGWNLRTLSIGQIRLEVYAFIEYAKANPETVFAVTRIGCGLAGYHDEDIAPLFNKAPSNCSLPTGWRK